MFSLVAHRVEKQQKDPALCSYSVLLAPQQVVAHVILTHSASGKTQEVPKLPGKIQDCFAAWEVAQYMDILEELHFNPSL